MEGLRSSDTKKHLTGYAGVTVEEPKYLTVAGCGTEERNHAVACGENVQYSMVVQSFRMVKRIVITVHIQIVTDHHGCAERGRNGNC